MITPADIIARKKLVLAKQMFQRALRQSASSQNVFNRLDAVIGFDFANEVVIKAALREFDLKVDLTPKISSLLELLKTELQKQSLDFNYGEGVKYVRNVRNAAQHEVRYPNDDELAECKVYTRDFLNRICVDVWSSSFDSLSLVDLIVDASVRAFLVSAEEQLSNGNNANAAVQAVAAFEYSTLDLGRTMIGDFRRGLDVHLVTDWALDSSSGVPLQRALNRIQELLTMQILGIDAQKYLRFVHFSRNIQVFFYEDGHFDHNLSSPEPLNEEVSYIVTFVTDAILQIQSLDDTVRFAAAPT